MERFTTAVLSDAWYQQILDLLERRRRNRRPDCPPRAVSAIEIADALGIGLEPERHEPITRERRRRAVRDLIRQARRRARSEGGPTICSTPAGYYLPTTTADITAARDAAKHDGLAHMRLARYCERAPELSDTRGQFALNQTKRSRTPRSKRRKPVRQ